MNDGVFGRRGKRIPRVGADESCQTPDGTVGDDEQAVVDPRPDDGHVEHCDGSPSLVPLTPTVDPSDMPDVESESPPEFDVNEDEYSTDQPIAEEVSTPAGVVGLDREEISE